jgi:hypothetical protein
LLSLGGSWYTICLSEEGALDQSVCYAAMALLPRCESDETGFEYLLECELPLSP